MKQFRRCWSYFLTNSHAQDTQTPANRSTSHYKIPFGVDFVYVIVVASLLTGVKTVLLYNHHLQYTIISICGYLIHCHTHIGAFFVAYQCSTVSHTFKVLDT